MKVPIPHRITSSNPARCGFFLVMIAIPVQLCAQAVSSPAILQLFEAKWDVIEDRMSDIFDVGYGAMWVPPANRAGGVFSVGYDLFDRFDLGKPRDETHYGTETSFGVMVNNANLASVEVYPDLIINHNGFGNRNDGTFVTQGGYPGFALTLPGVDINGDFHDPSISIGENEITGQLSGLNDIAQEKNHRFFRHPVNAGDPDNIPAGTIWNKPNASNTQFYPDQGLGGTLVSDPEVGGNATLYDFNSSDPFQGDPIIENAVDLLKRNVRWMVQKFGVKGFRIDAAKHSPEFTLDHIDQGVFRAIQELQHDGSIEPVYMFSEIFDGNKGLIQSFIRRDLPNKNAISPSNTTVGGNRDALDFTLFFALRDNLNVDGNWHNIRGASQDANDRPGGSDVWHADGSQGVAFVQSHDEGGPFLQNVAYAYTLMRPGQAIVYTNAEQFGPTSFPQPGKVDALGGFFGDTITKLVEIRNSHGRGDFIERWLDDAFNPNGNSNIYVYEREKSAIVALSSSNERVISPSGSVQTSFDPGTVLVELTGNAADGAVDPTGVIPEAIRVDGNGQIDLRIPGNDPTGRGYVIYGVAPPEGSMSLTNVVSTLSGSTPTAGNNGTARLSDIDVITSDSFTIALNTNPVTLPVPLGESNPVRDEHADGDIALLKIDKGIDVNGNGVVDETAPGSVSYGFEHFTDVSTPGYIYNGSQNVGTGSGTYEQIIDTTGLSEGRHFLTTRAFRHRDAGTGGDGGPAVYTDFKRTIYLDRLPPDSEVVSFEPIASSPTSDRDLIVRSIDKTAENMHVFLDLPVELTDAEVLQLVGGGNLAGDYDRDKRVFGYSSVTTGNHVVTIVTIEPTGNSNVQRFAGLFTQTNIGLGFGDLSGDGSIRANDLVAPGQFQDVLESQNTLFNAAADSNGDGLVDNRDLFDLEEAILSNVSDPVTYQFYEQILAERGDFDGNSETDVADLADIYNNLGSDDWLLDLNVDGVVSLDDAEVFVTQLLRSSPGDYNLDGSVDAADYTTWVSGLGSAFLADGDFDGDVDQDDYAVWKSNFGFQRVPFAPSTSTGTVVPEPGTLILLCLVSLSVVGIRRW